MKRKLIATLLVLGLMLAFVPMTIFSTSAENTWSTDGDQLYVTTADDLLAFATALAGGNTFSGKTINIMADIDVTGETWPTQGKDANFSGMIDGHGHTLTGIKSTSTSNYEGIFGGYLIPVSTFVTGVKNLTVKDSSVSGDLGTGGLFGQINNNDVAGSVVLDNLDLDIDVTGTSSYTGGIAGVSRADSMTISNSIVRGNISGTTIVGGMIGWQMDKALTVANSVVSADITTSARIVGGFFGQLRERAGGQGASTVVDGCVFDGTVKMTLKVTDWNGSQVGGFAGLVGDGTASAPRPASLTIKNSAFYGALEATTATVITKWGGFVGETKASTASVVKVENILVCGYMSGVSNVSAGNNGPILGWLNPGGTYNATNVAGAVRAIDSNHKALVSTSVGQNPVSGTPTDRTYSTTNACVGPDMFANPGQSSLAFKYSSGTVAFDLSSTFVATTATKPLPMGVVNFYADQMGIDKTGAVTDAYGYQTKTEGDTTSIRLIGLLKAEENLPAFESVGLEVVAIRKNGATVKSVNNANEAATDKVYTALMANDQTVKASDMNENYKYLFTVAVEGIQENGGMITLVVRSFHVVDGVRTYDDTRVINYDPANA